MSKEHIDGKLVAECGCGKCVKVFILISDMAEARERIHRLARAVELQDRVEKYVRVKIANDPDDADAVEILREDGRVALVADLNDDAQIRKIVRMRMLDLCASIAQRKEHTSRKMLVEEAVEAHKAGDASVNNEQKEAKEALSNALEALEPRDRMIFLSRFLRGMTIREIQDLLGISQKMVRTGEARALNQMRTRLSGFDQTPARSSQGRLGEPMLAAWSRGRKHLVAPLIGDN